MLSFNFEPFPQIETERLLLRKISMNDAGDLFVFRSDPEAMKYIARPLAKDMEDVNELIGRILTGYEKNEAINWSVFNKTNAKVIGTIGFHRIDKENYRGEIGYMLAKEYWNRGLMQEAILPVLKFGFDILQLHSIEAHVGPENSASRKLLLKNGFVQEAHFKENYFFEGKFHDTVIYSLLKQL